VATPLLPGPGTPPLLPLATVRLPALSNAFPTPNARKDTATRNLSCACRAGTARTWKPLVTIALRAFHLPLPSASRTRNAQVQPTAISTGSAMIALRAPLGMTRSMATVPRAQFPLRQPLPLGTRFTHRAIPQRTALGRQMALLTARRLTTAVSHAAGATMSIPTALARRNVRPLLHTGTQMLAAPPMRTVVRPATATVGATAILAHLAITITTLPMAPALLAPLIPLGTAKEVAVPMRTAAPGLPRLA